jgi:hypothetical protein
MDSECRVRAPGATIPTTQRRIPSGRWTSGLSRSAMLLINCPSGACFISSQFLAWLRSCAKREHPLCRCDVRAFNPKSAFSVSYDTPKDKPPLRQRASSTESHGSVGLGRFATLTLASS